MNTMALILMIQVLVELGLVAALLVVMPGLTRPDVFFAVTVAPGFPRSPEGLVIRRQYRRRVICSGCAAIAFALVLYPIAREVGLALAAAVGMACQIGVAIWAFVSARSQVRPHAAAPVSVREASLAPRRGLPWGRPALAIGPFLIIAAAVAFLAIRYDALPEQIPMHYNAAGEVDRLAVKSPKSVFAMPLIATSVCMMMTAITWSMGRGLKRSRATGPAAEREKRMLTLTGTILLVVQYFIALLFSTLGVVIVLPPEVSGRWVAILSITAVIAMPVLLIFLLLRYQRAASSSPVATGNAAPVGDGTSDANWIWGMIYYNPDDPALWVEKRFGIGYTTNMARPGAWVLLGGIVLFVGAMLAVAIWATK